MKVLHNVEIERINDGGSHERKDQARPAGPADAREEDRTQPMGAAVNEPQMKTAVVVVVVIVARSSYRMVSNYYRCVGN